jgi:hypothetical protein
MRDSISTSSSTKIIGTGVFQINVENFDDKYSKFNEISLNDRQTSCPSNAVQSIISKLVPDDRKDYISRKLDENLPKSYLISNVVVFSVMSIFLISIQIVMIVHNAALNEICTGIWCAFVYISIIIADLYLGKNYGYLIST